MKRRGRSGRKGGSSGKMFRSSSKSSRPRKSSGGGFFGRKSSGKTSRGPGGPKDRQTPKPSKPVPGGVKKPPGYGGEKRSDDFVKPPHDPGPKTAEEIAEDYGDTGSWQEDSGSGGGGGCCSSISGLMSLIVIGVIIVVIIVVLKCTSCI